MSDEREALISAIAGQYFCPLTEGGKYGSHIHIRAHEARAIAGIILAAGFRRLAQNEPTDEQEQGETRADWQSFRDDYRVAFHRPAQTKPEYEYSWGGVDDEGDDWIMDEWFATVAGAEQYADSLMGNWVRTDNGKLIRRVKAGDWEPVPGVID